MPSLSRDLRRLLEKTIAGENGARRVAEEGAKRSLEHLAVDRPEPHGKPSPEERKLRNQLRAHGRQLGDKRDPQRSQSIVHLKQAVAYEHWHRMLFARFLAENDLLLHPEHRVALSLDEVKELALSEKRDWIELAADFAQRMLLSAVFSPDDPALRVPLARETRLELERKLNSLPREIFLADDSLGWVYQFWQKDAKERVNESGEKIGADELAPVTQLFTEDYMVLFLLENALGAWWTARRGSPELPGYKWPYLRLSEDGTPAAGRFDGWPKTSKELRILDPCMGSGHFLTFALPIISRMRAAEEGLALSEATFAALRDNLFGLELDPRCSQIAAFNLALMAWKLCGHHFDLPPLNLACSGLAVDSREDEWTALASNNTRAEETLRRLFTVFSDAPTIGSLIDPNELGNDLFVARFSEVRSLFESALASQGATDELREIAIAASGILAAARLLSSRFTLVCTNVPYLGREGHCEKLANFADDYASDASADLSTLMFHRCLRFLERDCTFALVLPQNWWVGRAYLTFRKRVLNDVTFRFAVVLGEEAWWTFGNRGPNTVLMIGDVERPNDQQSFLAIDVSSKPGAPVIGLDSKSAILRGEPTPELGIQRPVIRVQQSLLAKSKGARISVAEIRAGAKLSQIVSSGEGCSTGDADRFLRCFWETGIGGGWLSYCGPGYAEWHHCDASLVIHWENGTGELARSPQARMQNIQMWTQKGVLVGRVRGITATLFNGGCFSKGAVLVCPHKEADLPAVYAFLRSSQYELHVRTIDPRVSAATSILTDVPFDLSTWQTIAAKSFPNGLPVPDGRDPSQATFGGQIRQSKFPLQVAVARLVGYRWPRQIGAVLPGCLPLQDQVLSESSSTDGVVCFAALSGENSASDRLRRILQDSLGATYNMAELLQGKKSKTPESWLLDEFFEEHCGIFHNGQESRPFIWHIWDGLRDGFHALLNYQKLNATTLEKLIYSYLGDWLGRQRQDVADGVEGAETRLAAAEHLQDQLKKIREGECAKDKKSGYDIFARWKRLSEQPIGWEPDLNDGVRINIRPWITSAYVYKAINPGILRVQPSIRFTKDRGKEPPRDAKEFPWFNGSTERLNNCHLSLDEKKRARGFL